ncbi:hypothetical protein DFS33DRAFT_1380558 [Desarmillaria ectypa]|nr:hypothetical protein DFS33DRAFT_1380558 [Desarmillaria ectypa]
MSAWILVDDVPLPEFGEEVLHAEQKVTCWVPSEAGKILYQLEVRRSVSDDEELLHNSTLSELGEIRIDILRVQKLARSPFRAPTFGEVGKIHEHSKKAISHCANAGDEISVPKPKTFNDVKKLSHLVTFIFRYRPLGILQANDIAPVPEPTPVTRKRAASPADVIDISDDSDKEDNYFRIQN